MPYWTWSTNCKASSSPTSIDIRAQFRTTENAFLSQNAIFASTLVRDSGQAASATIDQFSGIPVSAVSGFKEEASPWVSRNRPLKPEKRLVYT